MKQAEEAREKYERTIAAWTAAANEFNLVEMDNPVEGDKKFLDNLQTTTLAMVSAYDELIAAMEGLK